MSASRRTFYITTPIYYVNDRPHIGHSYTTTVCDVVARFHRFLGLEVFFLTGTDEHGIKVEKSAAERGVSPQALADENAAEFQRVLRMLDFTNDDFIRTTEPRHTLQVERFVQRLIASGDIYLGQYEGWYDEGQEEFVPDTRAKDQDHKSVISGKPLVRMREENYFFRLSAYQQRLEKLYEEHPEFVRPEARRNEMLGRLRDGLQDVPVTRTSFSWGISIPGQGKHVLWVWLDALSNYVTTLGLGLKPDEMNLVPRDRVDKLLETNTFRHDLAKATSSQAVWPLLLFLGACLFVGDVFIRRVTVSFDWLTPYVRRVTNRLLGRQTRPDATATMDRLRSQKAAVTGQLEQKRASLRFEPVPEAKGDVASLEDTVASTASAAASDQRKASLAAEREEEGYTERLLKAKKKAQGSRKKDEPHGGSSHKP